MLFCIIISGFTFIPVMYSKIKESCQTGFQRFCDGTSCHGFSELYHAKSYFWAAIWLTILIAAFALSAYQTHTVIVQYTQQPTTTVITPSKESQILYPPLRLCHALWMFWIDWQKARDMGFSKSSILFAVSYMNVIFTTEDFDVSEAKKDFLTTMDKNNLSTLTQFYSSVAKKLQMESENGFSLYFDLIEIYFKYPGYMLCYTITERQMNRFFTDNEKVFENNDGQKIISFQLKDLGYRDISEFVTPLEYNRYTLRWIGAKSMYKVDTDAADFNVLKLSKFTPPMLLYPNGYNTESVDLLVENDAYVVDMTAASRALRNTAQNQCLENVASFSSNRTCRTYCRAIRDRKCTCRSLDLTSLLNEDYDLDDLCVKGIYLVNSMSKSDDVFLSDANRTYNAQSCPLTSPDVKSSHERCKSTCVPACEIWVWDTTVSVMQMSEMVRSIGIKSMTNVSVEYPTTSKIMMMNEEVWSTWENLLGNIGGLLGVWTGASLLSVIQLFYLCCFAGTSMYPSRFVRRLQQNREIDAPVQLFQVPVNKVDDKSDLSKT